MSLPDLSDFCLPIHVRPDGICISIPGGAEYCVSFPSLRPPDPSEYTAALLAQVNTALGPLVPIFDIIDAIVALYNCFKAVEDALTEAPPDPMKIAECLPGLAAIIQKLKRLIPQLSIPAMIGAILEVLVLYFIGLRGQILAIIRANLRVLQAATKAGKLGSFALSAQVDCARADLDAFLKNLNANAEPLGRLIVLLNALLKLAGSDVQIPTVSNLGQDANAILAPLDAIIEDLQVLRSGFP